ncbi:MAG: glycosyltransferase family 2 protein [Patescibacteria group bacterium]
MIATAVPAVSVVIPTYNRKALLPRVIGSILAQTEHDLEIIIVDDGSTDDTEAWFRATYADPRIRYERLAQNQGVHVVRNRGLELARGASLVFLDSDDELLPDALERGQKALDGGFGMCIAPFRRDDGSLTSFDRQEGELPFIDLLCEHGMRDTKNSFAIMRREAIGDVRFAGKNLDFIFYRRVGARTRIYFLPEPLGLYHEGEVSMTKARKVPDIGLSIVRARVLADFLDEFGQLLIEHRPLMYGFYAYGASVGLLLAGETKRAREFARGAARQQPRLKYIFWSLFVSLPFSPALAWLGFSVKKVLYKFQIRI